MLNAGLWLPGSERLPSLSSILHPVAGMGSIALETTFAGP